MIRAMLLALLAMATPAAAETIAIVHARAYTLEAPAPIEDATIVMAQGRIRSVVAHGAAPVDARVVDAGGHIVTPGLVSGATALGLAEVLGASDTVDQSVSSGPLGPAFDVRYAFNARSTLIPVARADGLTRAMIYPGGSATAPFSGQGALIRLVPAGDMVERPGAAMFAAVGDATLAKAGGSRAVQWGLLRNALAEARRFAGRRAAGPRDDLLNRPDVEALQPVIAGAVPLAIQADRESDIRQAIRLAADAHVRVVIVGGAEAWRAAPDLAAAHIAVVLDPEADLPQTFDALGARLDNAAILARAGVAIAFTVPGNSVYLSYDAGIALREGAGIAVANGLPYAQALRAITAGAARIWGWGAGVGTLAVGADADVVIWDGDPLEPASAPLALFIGGAPVPLATRQTELRDRYSPSHAGDALPAGYR